MLEKCRKALRISGNEFDDEIQDLINACIKELEESGVNKHFSDPLYERTVITYVKEILAGIMMTMKGLMNHTIVKKYFL